MKMEDPRSDAELLRLSGRDVNAFGVFYDRHVAEVGSFFLRRTADHALAAELTSETFARAFASRRRYRFTGGLASGWLYTIAARQLTDYFRRQSVSRRYRDRLGIPVENSTDDFDRVDDLDDLRRQLPELQAALDCLTADSSRAVTLRLGHGSSYAEIARQLGCSPAAARVRVSRALARLQEQMKPSIERPIQ